jgi:Spy/CpxP family protein refolding chaperone
MGEMMQRRLGLTEEESASLSEIAEEFMPLRRALARDEQAVRRRVEALTLEAPTDDAEASELLARLVDLRRQDAELFVQEQDRMLEVLTPRQVLQMHALREELGERIRRLRRGRGNSGGNGTPGRHQLGDDVSER